MTLAIRQLLEQESPPSAPAIELFLTSHSFPLVEGTTATIVYHGAADSVLLQHWIYGLPSSQPFIRLDGTNFWYLVLEVPERSRIEYKIDVVANGQSTWILDPLNPLKAHDPYGANSICQGQGYERPAWTLADRESRSGELQQLDVPSKAFGEMRPVTVYLPARMRPSRRYPMLVVHDGADYLKYAGLQTVLDNLIDRFEIPQMIVALTQSPNRKDEYADDPRHARFLVEDLLPLMEDRYPLAPEPAARGLMGASFGAVASLAAAWRFPGVFGRLLLQSGSFAFTDIGKSHGRGDVFDPVVRFMNTFRDAPGRPVDRLFISCGIYESLIYENRSLVPLLQGTNMEVRFVETRDGHNWENWRDQLREGLAWLFPGPLWMVYE